MECLVVVYGQKPSVTIHAAFTISPVSREASQMGTASAAALKPAFDITINGSANNTGTVGAADTQTQVGADAQVQADALATAETAAGQAEADRREQRATFVEQPPRREGSRLFLWDRSRPQPVRFAILVGAGADRGLTYFIEAPESWDYLEDGWHLWPDIQECLGFQFRSASLVTTIYDEAVDGYLGT